MRAETGRLPGRDVTRDPGMYMFLYYLSHSVYIIPLQAGRFLS